MQISKSQFFSMAASVALLALGCASDGNGDMGADGPPPPDSDGGSADLPSPDFAGLDLSGVDLTSLPGADLSSPPNEDAGSVPGIAFEAVRAYPGMFSAAIAVADVTGDGNLDVVGPNHWDETIEVLPSDGKAHLGTHLASMVNVYQPELFALADIDGDGDLDVMVGNGSQTGIEWRKNDGHGAFGSPSTISFLLSPGGLWLDDFTGDHVVDLVVLETPEIRVYPATSPGVFATTYVVTTLPSEAEGPLYGDFTGDGKLDIAWVSAAHAGLCAGKGDGSFDTCTTISLAGGQVIPFGQLIHIDQDAAADLAVLGPDGISLFRGTPNGFVAAGRVLANHQCRGAISGDFDGDGDPDLAVALDSSQVTILRNDGGSGFTQLRNYNSAALQLHAADLDKDGHLDLLASDAFDIQVMRGRGDGTFHGAEATTVADFSNGLTTGDFDKDGHLDIITIGSPSSSDVILVNVQLQKQPGLFSDLAQDLWPGSAYPAYVRVADVDGDGKLDLAGWNSSSSSWVGRSGRGDGTFSAPTAVTASAWAYAQGDFDGDNKADWVRVKSDGAGIEIRLAKTGSFVAVNAGLTYVDDLLVNDTDHDGKTDLVVIDQVGTSQADLVLLHGRGDGTFDLAVRTPAATAPWNMAAADVDGDGDLDIVAMDDSGLSLWRAQGSAAFDAPTAIDTPGLQYGRTIALADFDRNGKVDLAYASGTGCAVFAGDGHGGFTRAFTFYGANPDLIEAVDLDGDGRLDLLGSGFGLTWHARNISH